jgi:uncharacterized coiled-coil DUF342 family protein
MSDSQDQIAALTTRCTELSRALGMARAESRRCREERDRARADAREMRAALLELSADAGAGQGQKP